MTEILGIVNLTRDSFSDGGNFLAAEAALAHARQLLEDGADLIDLGAESSHPDAEAIDAGEELARLEPVLMALVAKGVPVSVDTCKPAVMRRALELGAACINDITALADPASIDAVRDSDGRLLLMHSITGGRAERKAADGDPVARIIAFFRERLDTLERAGIDTGRVILDPGMGFFLGDTPEPSLEVLRRLPELLALGRPVCISTSRKSFIGDVLDRRVEARGAGTLATELFASEAGCHLVRTHDVRALKDALQMFAAIRGS